MQFQTCTLHCFHSNVIIIKFSQKGGDPQGIQGSAEFCSKNYSLPSSSRANFVQDLVLTEVVQEIIMAAKGL